MLALVGSSVLGLAPYRKLNGGLEPPTSSLYGVEHETFGKNLGTWTMCSVNASQNESDAYSHYTNPLWPNGLHWMKLPPNTHLLLFGRSSIGEMSSAIRAASVAYGILSKTVVVSAARDCADPAEDPHAPQEKTCPFDCDHFATLGPQGFQVNATVDPHSITVDYLTGNRTITTFSNHAQSQRLDSRLDDWLSMIAGWHSNHFGTTKFSHGVFMDPHDECWFDDRCDSGSSGEPQLDEALKRRSASRVTNVTIELCEPWSDGECPMRHPHYSTFARWVLNEPAIVLLPPREKGSRIVPFEIDIAEQFDDEFGSKMKPARCPNYEEAEQAVPRRPPHPPQPRHPPRNPPPPPYPPAKPPGQPIYTYTPWTPPQPSSPSPPLPPQPPAAPPSPPKPPYITHEEKNSQAVDDYVVPKEYELKCVRDDQLTRRGGKHCPNGRNTTVWLAQAKLVYGFEGATRHPSSTCLCTHLCNARCVLDSSSGEPQCYAGPGVAGTWLILRAAGLAQTESDPPLQYSDAMF